MFLGVPIFTWDSVGAGSHNACSAGIKGNLSINAFIEYT
jgi:hypothetical protein